MKQIKFLAVLAVIACLFMGCSHIEEIFMTKKNTSQSSPSGGYSLSLYQVGDPEWPFGSVKAKLVLYDTESKIVDETQFELNNDGGGVTSGNIVEVVWLEDHVEIHMKEFDTVNQFTYVLNYDN